ncbi:arginine repressor [Vibrio aphrogenes]|uniref:arginine repressor n=1 Tax=Vibrio aphrogenes TaxID=1891186 RepID=UPI000B360399|nr:arginine repressor [Vibrio aphrogenes]
MNKNMPQQHFNETNPSLIEACKKLLKQQSFANQNDIRKKLIDMGYNGISQSTISRLLTQLGVIKVRNAKGEKVYCITLESSPVRVQSSILSQIEFINHNQHNVIIKTYPGSAQLIARLLDNNPHLDILGTIAGNDTILIIPADINKVERCERLIKESLGMS